MGKWFSLHYNLFSLTEIERQEADIRLCTERIALVDKQKEYLEKNIAESEKNLRELIQTRRQQWKWGKGITTGLSLTFYIYQSMHKNMFNICMGICDHLIPNQPQLLAHIPWLIPNKRMNWQDTAKLAGNWPSKGKGPIGAGQTSITSGQHRQSFFTLEFLRKVCHWAN
jgi:hypothetical protein